MHSFVNPCAFGFAFMPRHVGGETLRLRPDAPKAPMCRRSVVKLHFLLRLTVLLEGLLQISYIDTRRQFKL
jgi:hypothetical protein